MVQGATIEQNYAEGVASVLEQSLEREIGEVRNKFDHIKEAALSRFLPYDSLPDYYQIGRVGKTIDVNLNELRYFIDSRRIYGYNQVEISHLEDDHLSHIIRIYTGEGKNRIKILIEKVRFNGISIDLDLPEMSFVNGHMIAHLDGTDLPIENKTATALFRIFKDYAIAGSTAIRMSIREIVNLIERSDQPVHSNDLKLFQDRNIGKFLKAIRCSIQIDIYENTPTEAEYNQELKERATRLEKLYFANHEYFRSSGVTSPLHLRILLNSDYTGNFRKSLLNLKH